MNKIITSREAILGVAKKMVAENGVATLNIRDVAKECGVAIGSIYNYFPSKSDLVVASVGVIWQEIVEGTKTIEQAKSFDNSIALLFERVKKGSEKYPSFFSIHSMSFAQNDKSKGKEAMNSYFEHIKRGLLSSLESDTKVSKDAFNSSFKKSEFIDFVFSNVLSLLISHANSCEQLLEIIRRTIYF